MCVMLSMYGPCRDVEPITGLALQLRTLGAEVEMCTPQNCAVLPGNVGVLVLPGARR
jgi:hypothetical protein